MKPGLLQRVASLMCVMDNIAQNPLGVSSDPVEVVPIKYCLYARKSTESDEKQALSIDSQVNEMLAIARRDNLEIVDIRRESFSSKEVGKRPVFNQMLEDVKKGQFDGLLTWAPDRLSRNAGDLGAIVDLLDRNALREVRTFGQKFGNNPNEKFLLMILGSQAKLENDQKGVNVKRGLRTRCEMGLWPAPAPTGYLNYNLKDRKCEVYPDPERAHIIAEIFERYAYQGMSAREIEHWLRYEIEFRTTGGRALSLSNIYKILKQPFYYGIFEYPSGGGNWYKGKHKPVISKELFMRAQERMKQRSYSHEIRRNDFAFTRLMKCGSCGSGVSAQEKVKTQKNGNINRWTYYGCTRGKNRQCREPYIREEKVIRQISQLLDEINIEDITLGEQLEKEMVRYSNFQLSMLGITKTEKINSGSIVNLKSYAKYLLQEGTLVEKRAVLSNLKDSIVLKNSLLSIL